MHYAPSKRSLLRNHDLSSCHSNGNDYTKKEEHRPIHDYGLEETFRPSSIAVTLESHDFSGEEIAQGYHGLNHKNKGRCSIDSGVIAEWFQAT